MPTSKLSFLLHLYSVRLVLVGYLLRIDSRSRGCISLLMLIVIFSRQNACVQAFSGNAVSTVKRQCCSRRCHHRDVIQRFLNQVMIINTPFFFATLNTAKRRRRANALMKKSIILGNSYSLQ